MYQLDLDILYFFNHTLASNVLDSVMIFLTNSKSWRPVYVIAAIILIWRYKWYGVRIVTAVALIAGIADLITNRLIKDWIARPRPCSLDTAGTYLVDWIRLPDGPRGGFSMPSSHAVNNFAAAAFFTVIFSSRKAAIALFVIALVIAITRPYLGLHYPSDIAVGAIAGGLFGYLCGKGFLAFEQQFFNKPKSKP